MHTATQQYEQPQPHTQAYVSPSTSDRSPSYSSPDSMSSTLVSASTPVLHSLPSHTFLSSSHVEPASVSRSFPLPLPLPLPLCLPVSVASSLTDTHTHTGKDRKTRHRHTEQRRRERFNGGMTELQTLIGSQKQVSNMLDSSHMARNMISHDVT